MMRTLKIGIIFWKLSQIAAVLSTLAGCVQSLGPATPPASVERIAFAERHARLDAEIIELKAMLREVRETKTKYTGAFVHVASGWSCPPCERLKRDLKEKEYLGWKIGTKPTDHFRLIGHDENESVEVPFVEYVRDDTVFETLTGYAGDINQVLRLHPAVKKTPKRATGAADYGTTYGSPVYSEPIYYGSPVWAPPVVFRDSAPVTYQTDYFFGIPVRQRQCVNGVCW